MTETSTQPFDPGFSWDEPLSTDLILNLATFGDQDMRERIAASDSITTAAATELLSLGDEAIAAILAANEGLNDETRALAAHPARAAKVINRQRKSEQRAAAKAEVAEARALAGAL